MMQYQMKKVAQLHINEELHIHPSTWQESLVLLCSSETYKIKFECLYMKTNTQNSKEKKKP